MTLREYRDEVFSILSSITTTDNIQWVGQNAHNEYPLITYARFDLDAEYSFGLNLESLSYYTEVRIYASDIDVIDDIVDEIFDAMMDRGYMLQSAPAEFTDDGNGENVSILRFYKV